MTTPCKLYLLAIRGSLADFATLLAPVQPIIKGRVSGWAVAPTHLAMGDWDVALLLREELPEDVCAKVVRSWQLDVSVPDAMIAETLATNEQLLSPKSKPVLTHEWTGAVPQECVAEKDAAIGELPITPARAAWMREHGTRPEGNDAVTMLNLLAYTENGRQKFAEYAAAFQPSFSMRYGTALKLFGAVDAYDTRDEDVKRCGYAWDECAMVHYPSIWHFGEMLSSPEYAALEHRYKVGALRDTCILCISETGLQ